MRLCLANREHPCVFILEYASQLVRDPIHLDFTERTSMLRLLKAAGESQLVPVKDGGTRRVVQNLLVLLCDKQADLPPWLYLNNPFTGSIEIDNPRSYERRHFFELFMAPAPKIEEAPPLAAPLLAGSAEQQAATSAPAETPVACELNESEALEVRLEPAPAVATLLAPEAPPSLAAGSAAADEPSPGDALPAAPAAAPQAALEAAPLPPPPAPAPPEAEATPEPVTHFDCSELVDLTDGMTVRDLCGIRAVARRPENGNLHAKALIDCYKYGVRESEWDNLGWHKLAAAEEVLARRVIGQPAAVTAVADMLRRARLHLSGAQHSSRTKPRGVLFFAGWTGVGKTEMAKALAELIFGSEETCVRFDMSEYSLAHADQRLLGAPPGYLGYEEGGQLTNHVRSNPFSVLLFDEIEKAHPSILDKFLQILEDGRITNSRGETVYFSETVVIFTSNVGIYQLDQNTGRPLVNPLTGRRLLNVDPEKDIDYHAVREKVIGGVEAYFKHFLGPPGVAQPHRRKCHRLRLHPPAGDAPDHGTQSAHLHPVAGARSLAHGGGIRPAGGGSTHGHPWQRYLLRRARHGQYCRNGRLNPLARTMFHLLARARYSMARHS